MCQPWLTVEINFMETITPTAEEKNCPEIFASNVQKKIAKAHNLNYTDIIAYDAKCINFSCCENNYHHETGMIGVEQIKRLTGIPSHAIATHIFRDFIEISNIKDVLQGFAILSSQKQQMPNIFYIQSIPK